MNLNVNFIRKYLADLFSLHEDSAHDNEIIDSITRSIEFRGSNVWALIFAIFIASIGLNVNSTAVIIGAMLVSPLMGPIMGFGLGIGINDIELIRKALKNLLLAVVVSVCVSTFYFLITPLREAQSELLARTTPSIWDVFIALFGGLAGIVGSTRKEKSNVIPGVAIATALMPPLCTAGYGLAVGNIYYFLGAFYLFFINSVFICISTYVIVKYMKLPKKVFEDKGREKKVVRAILLVVSLTALPSIYLAYRIVDKSFFESNAGRFVKNEVKFPNTHIVSKAFKYESGKEEIDLLLIGDELTQGAIDSLKSKLGAYNISRAKLSLSQGYKAAQQVDYSQIKASILQELFSLEEASRRTKTDTTPPLPDIGNELKALYPNIRSYSITRNIINDIDSGYHDTVFVFMGNFSKKLPVSDKAKLKNWVKNRIKADSVMLMIEAVRK